MRVQRIESNEQHETKVVEKSRILYSIFKIVFVLNIVIWLTIIVLAVVETSQMYAFKGVLNVLSICFLSITVTAILWLVKQIYKSAVEERAIFTLNQVKRIRAISYALLAFFVVDAVFSSVFSSIEVCSIFSIGYSDVPDSSDMIEPTISFNVGSLVTVALVYSLSVIFEYGTELQQQADSMV